MICHQGLSKTNVYFIEIPDQSEIKHFEELKSSLDMISSSNLKFSWSSNVFFNLFINSGVSWKILKCGK